MKQLIDWARQQKQRGKLKQLFQVYGWCKKTEAEILAWWRRNVTWRIYQWGVALYPNWDNGHYTLGKALQLRYTFLSGLKSCDAAKLADIENRAIAHYRKALELRPEKLAPYTDLLRFLGLSGSIAAASIVLQQFEDMKRSLAEARQEDRLAIRFVPSRLTWSIGLLGNLDYYVKAGLLEWRPPHRIIMLLPHETPVSNQCFLDYWRQHITVISDPETIKALSPLVEHLEDPVIYAQTCNGRALFGGAANTMIQKQWDAEGRPPLMTLSTSDYERGWSCLEGLGMPQDAWFVCLHVREPGFKDQGLRGDSFRNADIDTYLPAVKTIITQGGWVIRMGNPTMKPLPEMDHVIDYAHSDVRSDWMDVFLASQCRFIIGTASGPNPVSIAFGVPMVLTNYLPWHALHFSNQDLFLPRLFRSLSENRRLTFREILSSPLSGGVTQSFYDNSGVEILANTPDEINDVVIEMLMRQEGTLTYSAADERLQERFQSLTAICNTNLGAKDLTINCRMGKDFLRGYETLLDAEVATAIRNTG